MNKTATLSDQFRQTYADRRINSNERRALAASLASAGLVKAQRDALVSELFTMIGNDLGKGHDAESLEWLRSAVQVIGESMEASPDAGKVYFSPGPDCLGAILHAINGTRRTLDICVFTVSDDRIREAILMRKVMGVKIRVLTDNEKLLDEGSDISAFDKTGIPVKVDRTANHMHHKFAIFDNSSVITGSYNWTRSAEAFNHENIVLEKSPSVVKTFTDTFEKLWKEMKPF